MAKVAKGLTDKEKSGIVDQAKMVTAFAKAVVKRLENIEAPTALLNALPAGSGSLIDITKLWNNVYNAKAEMVIVINKAKSIGVKVKHLKSDESYLLLQQKAAGILNKRIRVLEKFDQAYSEYKDCKESLENYLLEIAKTKHIPDVTIVPETIHTVKRGSSLYRTHQKQFRKAIIDSFNGRCAVTGCALAVEAAHIRVLGEGQYDDSADNGIALCGDLHYLFDNFYMGINPVTMTVHFKEGTDHLFASLLEGKPVTNNGLISHEKLLERWNKFLVECK